jgi:hypothetical protein
VRGCYYRQGWDREGPITLYVRTWVSAALDRSYLIGVNPISYLPRSPHCVFKRYITVYSCVSCGVSSSDIMPRDPVAKRICHVSRHCHDVPLQEASERFSSKSNGDTKTPMGTATLKRTNHTGLRVPSYPIGTCHLSVDPHMAPLGLLDGRLCQPMSLRASHGQPLVTRVASSVGVGPSS